MGRKTIAISMVEPLQYLLITVKVVAFVNTLTVKNKHYQLNRDNLTQPIQMQLSQKQKTACEFFFGIFKI